MVQWFRLRASNAGGTGLIPCQGTRPLHAMQHSQKIKTNKQIKLGCYQKKCLGEGRVWTIKKKKKRPSEEGLRVSSRMLAKLRFSSRGWLPGCICSVKMYGAVHL